MVITYRRKYKMETIELNIYQFSELSESVQKKLIEENRCINVDYYDWYHNIIDEYTEKLEKEGFIEPKIHFSGFGNQGDGACFDCTSIDIDPFLKKMGIRSSIVTKIIKNNIKFNIVKNDLGYMYSHLNTRDVFFNDESLVLDCAKHPRVLNIIKNLLDVIENIRKIYSIGIFRKLEKEFDFLTSDEEVTFQLNEDDLQYFKNGASYPEDVVLVNEVTA